MARNLGLGNRLAGERERYGPLIPGLHGKSVEVDSPGIQSGTRSRLKPAGLKAKIYQGLAKSMDSEISSPARRVISIADMDQSFEKGPSRQDYFAAKKLLADLSLHAFNLTVFND